MSEHGDLVRLDRVTCRYGSEPVLVNVDLAVAEGEFVGVVGPSGSGKTTLLRTIMGYRRPVAHSVSPAMHNAAFSAATVSVVRPMPPTKGANVRTIGRNRLRTTALPP